MAVREQYTSDNCALYQGDTMQIIDSLPDNSFGFSMWSPPFENLYVYSDEIEDLGNSTPEQFDFSFKLLCQKLYPKIWAGRNVAIHCMDLPIQKGKEGYIGLRDFSGLIITSMLDAGFIYHSRISLWKNPVTEMSRTKALGLLHKSILTRSEVTRVGIPDYLLVFKKPGDCEKPVIHYQTEDAGRPNYTTDPNKPILNISTWQQYASPVWMDVDWGDTLNAAAGRDQNDERHICCLARPIINRATTLWTNEGDPCLSLFGGVGSEPAEWLRMKRKACAIELKPSYYREMVKNCKNAEYAAAQKGFFD